MVQSGREAIVLAGDYAYIRQVETTLKSLCYNNSFFKVYIFNQDIPSEWFSTLRPKLALIGVELIDIKLLDVDLNPNWTAGHSHINYMAFARYFIPKYVEERKVLYLDSDLVVTGDILHLFNLDLEDYYAAAVSALHGMTSLFNSGVLLINNKKWKEENLFETLIEVTKSEWENVPEGDQSILNIVFNGNWLHLDGKYNFPIGYDYGAFCLNQNFLFDIPIDPLPLVLHYISSDKPWRTYSKGRLRSIWWFYNSLDWSDIIKKSQVDLDSQVKILKNRLNAFTLTNTQNLEHLLELVTSLPDCHFNVASYTPMGTGLLRFGQYPNVTLYPNVMPVIIEQLVKTSDIYLDINHEFKFIDVISKAKDYGKCILSFDSTRQDVVEEIVFPTDNCKGMIEFIDKFTI